MNTRVIQKNFTYQDYLQLDDDNRYEVIKGSLLIVPAPNSDHQNISRNIEFLLCSFVYKNNLGEVFDAPYDIILDENNIVQPDIIFISKDRLNIIKERGVSGPPDLAVEIISPSSKSRDVYQKKELYENFKIKEYWIIDPANRTVEVFALNETGKYELYFEDYLDDLKKEQEKVKSALLPGLELNMTEIFHKRY